MEARRDHFPEVQVQILTLVSPKLRTGGGKLYPLPLNGGRGELLSLGVWMLLSIQFPLADSRRFVDTETGVLSAPGWPFPKTDTEFVRAFGSVKLRRRGGASGWVGENDICEAHRAVRFPLLPTFVDHLGQSRVPFTCAFRRFFFEGSAVGKFEVGLVAKLKRQPSQTLSVPKWFSSELLIHFLSLTVNIRTASGGTLSSKLSDVGEHLAAAYQQVSSTRLKKPTVIVESEDWWVQAGSPVLLVEHRTRDRFVPPFPTTTIRIPEEYGFKLSYGLADIPGRRIKTWVLALRSGSESRKARMLRLYLMRLHAEHECMKLVLRNINDKRIDPPAGSKAYQTLQRYLSLATRRIRKWELKTEGLSEPEVAELARQSNDSMTPGEAIQLLDAVAALGIDKQIDQKVNVYIENLVSGDFFSDVANSTIVTRGAINASLQGASQSEITQMQKQGKERLLKTTTNLRELIANDSRLSAGTTSSILDQFIFALNETPSDPIGLRLLAWQLMKSIVDSRQTPP
jgi:hypothetical protein